MLLVAAVTGLLGCGKSTDDTAPTAGTMSDSQQLTLVDCEPGSLEACGSIKSVVSGAVVDLGTDGVIMEHNVGVGFENPVAAGDSDGGISCQLFAAIFNFEPNVTQQLLDTMDLDFALYTVYRPANLEAGKKYPLITWGNGTCAQPEGYSPLLRYVASQGFIIVAANSRWVSTNNEMIHALDFMFAANEDPESPYYQLIDTDKVGAMGHSQGSMATATASSDPRIKTVILFNGGTAAQKPFLAVSGDMDIGSPTAASYASAIDAATEAAYLFYHMVPVVGTIDGHLTLMTQPERVIEPTANWFKYQLLGDKAARKWFVGNSCELCGHDAEYEYGEHGLH